LVHPYEDEQFHAEHPDLKAKEESSSASDLDAPPPYDATMKGRASEGAEKSGSLKQPDLADAVSGESSHAEHKRGVFGRWKDKAIGTKEEREELKRIKAEEAARAEERARQARKRQLEERAEYKRIRAEQAARAEEQARQARRRQFAEQEEYRRIRAEHAARAEEQARQARMRQYEEREAYMRAHGGYAPYHPSYGRGPGLGGDNTAALLLGGLAGGLLLGDVLGGF
jgi:hypothetical protein